MKKFNEATQKVKSFKGDINLYKIGGFVHKLCQKL